MKIKDKVEWIQTGGGEQWLVEVSGQEGGGGCWQKRREWMACS